jgi:hypothetical protein
MSNEHPLKSLAHVLQETRAELDSFGVTFAPDVGWRCQCCAFKAKSVCVHVMKARANATVELALATMDLGKPQ